MNCIHYLNGICEILSDETVQQPCIESPCPIDIVKIKKTNCVYETNGICETGDKCNILIGSKCGAYTKEE